ncbi:hypothetical protein GCM10011316_26090 [Roseibium aquae]|uniref:Uncharacterized protein n=1 Tax=Roseibium aquae TaxID=1323746 RepID=A0A916X2B4_9HYPH|nr:hypothetical protein [Roseibium aquae]GGB52825.1 hypothetical protein GCM10011316_26090 [Roseibium aquae]
MRHTLAKTAILTAVLGCVTTSVMAKDWIETVEVKRDGIDTIPIEVSANATKYTGIKSGSHKFLLRLHARATSGERIVAMKVGSFKGVRYFEADGNHWSKSFANREIGGGSKRTVSVSFAPTIPVNKIRWQGWDPREACALNLDKKIKSGMSRSEALSKTWTVSAKAYFELDAVAARKNKAAPGQWNMKSTTTQRAGNTYDVAVKCLPAPR